jgi:hypothetical protein
VVHPALRRRWSLLEPYQVRDGQQVLVDRLRIIQTPLGGLYLHCLHAEDRPGPHGHPWWFVSLVLAGSYREAVHYLDGSVAHREHRRFRPALLRMSQAHKITRIDGLVWTLVLAGPYHEDWLARWRDT